MRRLKKDIGYSAVNSIKTIFVQKNKNIPGKYCEVTQCII